MSTPEVPFQFISEDETLITGGSTTPANTFKKVAVDIHVSATVKLKHFNFEVNSLELFNPTVLKSMAF